ncbi:response regulator transcription factor [Streptomyces noursei]
MIDAARAGAPNSKILPEQRHVLDTLPERHREVLRHIGEGRSNAQIARRMYLTEATVKGYVSRLLKTFRLANRTQAAIFAHQSGILLNDDEHDRHRQ